VLIVTRLIEVFDYMHLKKQQKASVTLGHLVVSRLMAMSMSVLFVTK
jgi:hypothetical protein